eukprot:366546-Chlamydomonas_euryale.AAC.55
MASAPQEPAAQMPSAPQAGQAGSHAGSHAGYPPVSGGSSVLQAPGAVTVSAPMAPGPMPTDPSQVAGVSIPRLPSSSLPACLCTCWTCAQTHGSGRSAACKLEEDRVDSLSQSS